MDRALLLTARGLRAFGFGYAAVLLGIHLERRGLPPLGIGITLGVGLAAASLLGLASAWAASRIGRRGALAACGGLMALTGADLALSTSPALLALSGVTGMLGAASVDLGPFAAVEQAMLAEAAPVSRRSVAFGRYSLVGGLLNAAGGMAAIFATAGTTASFFGLYVVIGLVTGALPLLMSAKVEAAGPSVAFGSFKDGRACAAGIRGVDRPACRARRCPGDDGRSARPGAGRGSYRDRRRDRLGSVRPALLRRRRHEDRVRPRPLRRVSQPPCRTRNLTRGRRSRVAHSCGHA